eukprot:scaffold1410_cov386-Prasinococcus_capsulatus_cf.AAC.9
MASSPRRRTGRAADVCIVQRRGAAAQATPTPHQQLGQASSTGLQRRQVASHSTLNPPRSSDWMALITKTPLPSSSVVVNEFCGSDV